MPGKKIKVIFTSPSLSASDLNGSIAHYANPHNIYISQMMRNKPQGAGMGWLTTAGSLGRIIFPILAGISYDATTYVNVIFAIIAGVSAAAFKFIFGLED